MSNERKPYYFAGVCGDEGIYNENKGCIIANIQSITDLQENWNTILDELNELSADRDKQ